MSAGMIKVKSTVGGVDGYSIIDSGASVNAINDTFLKNNNLKLRRLGNKARIRGVIDERSTTIYAPQNVNIFGTDLKVGSLVGLNLEEPELQLILGAGFLKHFIFQFDYPNQRMRLLSRDAVNMKKVRNIESKRAYRGGPPLVKVRLNDEVDAWLLLDTGSSGGIFLDRMKLQNTTWLDEYETTRGSSRGVHQSGQTDRFILPSMRFGPFDLGDVVVRTQARGKDFKIFERKTSTGTHIPRTSSAKSGLIGHEVLKHFVITLDYKGGSVHIGTKTNP